jgi:hypothetical protein
MLWLDLHLFLFDWNHSAHILREKRLAVAKLAVAVPAEQGDSDFFHLFPTWIFIKACL